MPSFRPRGEPVRFTEGQRRHARVTLTRLILETREWIRKLEANETRGTAYDLLRSLHRLLDQAEAIAARLDIAPINEDADPRHAIAAWATAWWSNVLDLRPAAMHAYGDVDPTTAGILGPLAEQLASQLRHVETLAAARESG